MCFKWYGYVLILMCGICMFGLYTGHGVAAKNGEKRVSRRQAQKQLVTRIQDAFCVMNHALYIYGEHVQGNTSQRMHTLGTSLKAMSRDQETLYRYIEQALTGDPALSSDEIQGRITEVDHMITKWNTHCEGSL